MKMSRIVAMHLATVNRTRCGSWRWRSYETCLLEFLIFTARCYAECGYATVGCLSVRLSVPYLIT